MLNALSKSTFEGSFFSWIAPSLNQNNDVVQPQPASYSYTQISRTYRRDGIYYKIGTGTLGDIAIWQAGVYHSSSF